MIAVVGLFGIRTMVQLILPIANLHGHHLKRLSSELNKK